MARLRPTDGIRRRRSRLKKSGMSRHSGVAKAYDRNRHALHKPQQEDKKHGAQGAPSPLSAPCASDKSRRQNATCELSGDQQLRQQEVRRDGLPCIICGERCRKNRRPVWSLGSHPSAPERGPADSYCSTGTASRIPSSLARDAIGVTWGGMVSPAERCGDAHTM